MSTRALVSSWTILGVTALASAGGCGQSEPEPDPFECDVPALFERSCSDRVCHSGEDPAGGLDLVSPGLDQRLSGVKGTEDCGSRILVEPGEPGASFLYEKVTNEDPDCGRPMPPRGDRLTDEELECLREYIEEIEAAPSCETCGGILCVELATDPAHCGNCETACGEGMICAEGTCLNPCEAGTTLCGAECVDLSSDDLHCGACGHRCGSGSSCADSECACDPDVTATFSGDILPILEASCGGDDCHTGPEPLSSLRLTPEEAYEQLVAVGSDACEEATRVVPGEPGSSYLIDKMTGGAVCQGRRMPLFADSLPDAAIAKFVGWICAGAPND